MSEPYWAALGGGSVDYKGAWAAGTAYAPGDVVRHGGVDYLAVNPSTGVDPGVATGIAPPQTMELIVEKDLAASKEFTSIPQTYDHLRLVMRARSTGAVQAEPCYLRFNDYTDANYDDAGFLVNNGAFVNRQVLAQDKLYAATLSAGTALASWFGSVELLIPGYTDSFPKSLLGRSLSSDATLPTLFHESIAGIWRYGIAVTKITLIPGGGAFAANSKAWLYGIRGAP